MFGLRTTQGGYLIVAQVNLTPPVDASTAARIQQLLGFDLIPSARCAYGPDANGVIQSLWDVTVGPSPGTLVKSGTTQTVFVNGHTYQVSVLGQGFPVVTLREIVVLI